MKKREREIKKEMLILFFCFEIRKMMASGVTSEWTSLSVWGYKNSPYTWETLQHYQYFNGENDYTFLLLPSSSQKAYTYQLYGSHHTK